MSQTRRSIAKYPIACCARRRNTRRSAMGANVQLFPRSPYQQHQCSTVAHARAPALNLKGSRTWFFSAITVAFVLIVPTTTIAAEAQTNRMVVGYVPPTNPAHQALSPSVYVVKAYSTACP